MPIKFSCPNCQQQLEISSQHAGQQFKCPKCQQAVTAPKPTGSAPAAAPPAAEDHGMEIEEDSRPRRSKSRGGSRGGGGLTAIFLPPKNKGLFPLWLGLMLIMVGFTLKHIVVDLALTSTPAAMEYPRLIAEKQAKLYELDAEVDRLTDERNELRNEDAENSKERDKLREREDKLREQISKARDAAKDDRKKIEEDYRQPLRQAKQDSIESGAALFGWMQRGIWLKILIDLPKLLGCFLIVMGSIPVVSDPEEEPAIKGYAIACTTVVLLYSTLYAIAAFFS